MKKMKILLIMPIEYQGGRWSGVTMYTLNLAQELQRRKYEVAILCPGVLPSKRLFHKIPIYKIPNVTSRSVGRRFLNYFFPLFTERLQWNYAVYQFTAKMGQFDIIEAPEWGSSTLFLSI